MTIPAYLLDEQTVPPVSAYPVERVSTAPVRRLVRAAYARGVGVDELARRTRLSGQAFAASLRGSTMSLWTADRICTALGRHLAEICPDAYPDICELDRELSA